MEKRVHYAERDMDRILIDEETIQKRVAELGRQISIDYEGKDVLAICILRGCVMFYADLMKNIDIPIDLEFMATSSYGSGSTSSGNVRLKYDLYVDIKDRHVIIVEDIVDTGRTLVQLKKILETRGPASIKLCTLLDKKERRVVEIEPDYCGFVIPDEFVIGYGLDYDDKYRNYKQIGILKREIYE